MPVHTLDHYNPPTDPYLDILFEDNTLLVINKPAGLLSVPGRLPAHQDSVQLRAANHTPEARIVHRLDMATSGVLVLAKGARAQKHLGLQFEKRRTDKSYQAIVAGHPNPAEGSIDLPLIADWPNRPKQMVDHRLGKPALTHYKLLASLDHPSGTASRVKLIPVTGRSHQLRVHMLSLGHPILGDTLYGTSDKAERLLLHAHTLTVMHPRDREKITFTALLPF